MGLNILMVTPMPPQAQAPGAIPLVLHAGLSGLRERHQVSLVTIAGQEPGEQEAVRALLKEGIDVYAVLRSEPQGWQRWQRRYRLAHAWLTKNMPWRSVWFWEPALQRTLNQLFGSKPFDLVIVEDNAMGVYEYNTQAPLLFTEHEVRRPRRIDWRFWQAGSPPSWVFNEVDWRRWAAYQRQAWQKFDHLQVFSSRDAQAVHEIAPQLDKPIHINPFGVELPEPAYPKNEQPGRLLFAGNYTHAPNVDAALWLGREIMPRLQKLSPGVQLDLVGIYPPPEVRALASKTIHVTGPVPEMDPYIQAAALVLAPIRIGGGMRMKVLQSMAAGKAVVTTPRGAEGLDEWEDELPLAIASDADQFARTAAALLADAGARRALGEAARAYVADHFSPQAYARRVEAIYAAMVAPEKK